MTVEEALVLLKAGEHGRVAEQIRLLVERLECESLLQSDHVLNLLTELEGRLPDDRVKLYQETVDLLLAHGALPDLPQSEGVTPLMAVSGLKWLAINTRGRYLTEQDAVATAGLLLAAGADPLARARAVADLGHSEGLQNLLRHDLSVRPPHWT